MVVRLCFATFVFAGLLLAESASAAGRTCKDLDCGENAMCLMGEQGPRCVCQFGYERDRVRHICVSMTKLAVLAAPVESPDDACSPDNLAPLEDALVRRPLAGPCARLRSRYGDEDFDFPEMLRRRYVRRRNAGYSLMFLVTPVFAGAAIFFGVEMYRLDHPDEPYEGFEGIGAAIAYSYYATAFTFCVVAGTAVLLTGIGLSANSNHILDGLETFASDGEHASRSRPKLALAPFVDPAGAGGASLRVEF